MWNRRKKATLLMLDIVAGLADLRARAGEGERALALSLCVLSHPASTLEARSRAERLRAQLESQLTLERVEEIEAQAAAESFDAMVKDLLNTFPKDADEGRWLTPGSS